MGDLTKTELDLLSLVSNSLFDIPVDCSNMDWQEIEKESISQAVFLIAIHKNYKIATIVDKRQKLGITTSNNLSVNADHAYIHNLMTKNSIPYVILKGYASAYYYPEPIYRSMGDVDFLVPIDEFEKAKDILEAEGFVGNSENHICHISFKKGEKTVELHFAPAGMPEGKAGELAKEYMRDVFDTAVKIKTVDGTMTIPDAFHHGLILLFHTYHHLTGEGVGLRHLCDWAVFVNSLSNDEFESIFKYRLQAIGLWRFAQLLTQLSIKYLGMPKKKWAMESVDDELLADMIGDIFAGGNFGRKDSQRKTETMIISSRGKNGVGNNSMLSQFVESVNNIVYLKWPISVKLKFLLPLGWLFYGSRYALRMLFGKRDKINVSSTIEKASERRELYKEFKLFETQND